MLLFSGLLIAALALASSGRAAIETPPPPSVWSDKADYAPGEQVTLSGANWSAGESVHIRVNDDAGQTWSRDVDVTAAADGTISDQFNLPNWFVATYKVTATGASSGSVTWTFTDSNPQVITVSPSSFSVAQGATANYTVSLQIGGNTDPCDVTFNASGLPSGATATFNPATVTTTGSGNVPNPVTSALSVTTSATTPTGSFTINVSGTKSGAGCQGTGPTPASPTLVVTTGNTAPTTPGQPTASANPNKGVFTLSWTASTDAQSNPITYRLERRASSDADSAFALVTGASALTTNSFSYAAASPEAEGAWVYRVRASDGSLTSAFSSNSAVVTVDRTAPTVTAAAVKGTAPGFADAAAYTADTWTNQSVRVTYTCADAGGSGLTAASGNQVDTYTTDTTTTSNFSGTCADNAGNTAGPSSFGLVKVDKTAPSIAQDSFSPAANGAGWHNSNITVVFKASDSLSGLSSACQTAFDTPVTGGRTQDKLISTEGNPVTVDSSSCTDAAGNTAAAVTSSNFKLDKTAPVIALRAAGDSCSDPGDNGWCRGTQTAGFRATDATSGFAPDGDLSVDFTQSSSVNGAAVNISSGTKTDRAGNVATAINAGPYKIDSIAPVIAQDSFSPSANGAGWHNSNITVVFKASDSLSGLSSACQTAFDTPVTGGRTQDKLISTEGNPVTVDSSSCTDAAGNTAAAVTSSNFKLDKTAPGISFTGQSPDKNGAGWNNSDVVLSWSCTDGLSGPVNATKTQTIATEGTGQQATGTCYDAAGNSASSTNGNVNIDKTKPVVSVTGVSDGATYTLGSVPAAGCSTTDVLSHVKTSATLSSSGGPVGSITATCSGAEDNAGNTNSASATYSVNYNFTGFFAPVDNYPVCNVAKAGSAIPVKFTLHGYQGMSIFALGYPKATTGTCSASNTDAIEETSTASQSGLNYDATADQYIYVWKTDKAWAGKAILLTVRLADGTDHTARFSFMK